MRRLLSFVVAISSVLLFADDRPNPPLPDVPQSLRESVALEWRDLDPRTDRRSILLKLNGPGLTAAMCREALTIPDVNAIDAFGVRHLSDDQVEILTHFSKLKSFMITGKVVTDRCGTFLASCSELEAIDLYDTQFTDHGVAQLAVLKHLQDLSLRNTQVRGTNLSKLRQFAALESLDCGGTPADARICQELVQLKSLKRLHLDDTQVTDDAVGSLQACQSIEELYLSKLPQLTTDGFRRVIQLPKLRVLNVRQCQVSDAWLDAIKEQSPLRQLYLSPGAPFTNDGVIRLKRRNPQLKVYHGREIKPNRNEPKLVVGV